MLCGASLSVNFGSSMLCSRSYEKALVLNTAVSVVALLMMIMLMMALYAYCLANFNPSQLYEIHFIGL